MADRGFAEMGPDDAGALCLSEALGLYRDRAKDAQQAFNGRELMLFESEPLRIGRLIDLLVEGNYRETACRIVGISSRAIRLWMRHADEGDVRYQAVAQAILVAESLAESVAVRAVRAAGKDPRFWAAEMTYLERKYPDRWGRRVEDGSVPKVVVQIGIADSDVQIQVQPEPAKEAGPEDA